MSAGPLVACVNALDTQSGDGLIADAAVLAELGCRHVAIATAVVAAGAERLAAFEPLSPALVARQLDAASAGDRPAAAKVGLVANAAQASSVAAFLRRELPQSGVYAPVVRAASDSVMDDETLAAAREQLFPAARVVVVRAADLDRLVGRDASDIDGLRAAAARLRALGARAAVVAGLLVQGRVLDLVDDEGRVALLDTSRIQAPRVPGLAGAYAAALAAHLARGSPLAEAAQAAQRYVGFRLRRGR